MSRRPAEFRQNPYPPLWFPAAWKPEGNNLRRLFAPKELSIMDGIITGDNNRTIALRLATSEGVIKNYLRVIYDKAGVYTRLELAVWWLHHGYVSDQNPEELAWPLEAAS